MKPKTIFITGATSGIGEACAKRFAAGNYRLIITGRRKEKLEMLKEELLRDYNADVLILCFDIRSYNENEKAVSSLPENWKNIDILVNNAGLAAGLDPVQEGLVANWDRMIDTNLKGLLYITRNIVPIMIANGRGHVINIGSVAGKEVYPNGNVYCATKHAVDALSKGMRIDFLKHGIKVTQVAPGAVRTGFSEVRFNGDKERAEKVYQGFTPLSGSDVADAVFYVASLPAHVCINDLQIMPFDQANAALFNRTQ